MVNNLSKKVFRWTHQFYKLAGMILFFVCCNAESNFAQASFSDSSVIASHIKAQVNKDQEAGYGFHGNSVHGISGFFLSVYQEYISVLISADCIYSLSCSRYSKQSISQHGVLKGVLATGDRLSRCSSIAAKDIPEFKWNDDGYAEDLP
jgi:putative component of membrane protein insertase Oxa1/YidC/SpoIIIJ protein YidD